MGIDDFHECGGWVHASAESVGLPADDGIEATVAGVGEHSLELWTGLRPTSADLLVSRDDGQSSSLAVCFHLCDLLGDGSLVVLGLALV